MRIKRQKIMCSELQASVRNYQETSKGIAHEFRLSVGEAIIKGLEKKGWNQKKLAAQLGVSEPLISRLLNGDHNWTSEFIGKVGHALGIRFRAILLPLCSLVEKAVWEPASEAKPSDLVEQVNMALSGGEITINGNSYDLRMIPPGSVVTDAGISDYFGTGQTL